MKAFDYDLKLGPVVAGVLLMLAALSLVFFLLYVQRIRDLEQVDFAACGHEKTYLSASKCVGLKVRDHLKHPQWQAVQFVSYILVAIGVGALAAWLAGGQYLVVFPLVAVISALISWMLFKPAGPLPYAILAGGLLGGGIFHIFVKRPKNTLR